MASNGLSLLSTDLEQAGLLGTIAASWLSAIALDKGPGFLTTTSTGAVWTKALELRTAKPVDIKIGTFELGPGKFSCTAGFAFDDEGLTDFSLLLELSGAESASLLKIKLSPKVAYRAPAIKPGDRIVGYNRKAKRNPVELELPAAAAVEISIRRTNDGVQSALTLHGPSLGVSAARGLFSLDLDDDLLVLPWFYHIGLGIEQLFVDLSSGAATPVSGLFPEVYAPSWKGVGAKSVGLYIPVDDAGSQWVSATLDGFLLDFDRRLSCKGSIDYRSTESSHKIREAKGEIDIRNNEVIRGAFGLVLDLQRAAEDVNAAVSGGSRQGLGQPQKDVANRVEQQLNRQKGQQSVPIDGDLKLRVQVIRIPVDSDSDIFGFDFTLEAIETKDKPAGLVVDGWAARVLMWLGLGGAGLGLAISGADEDDGLKIAGGAGLLFLLAADLGSLAANGQPSVLPTLERLVLPRMTVRAVSIPEEGAASKIVVQFVLDAVISMRFDGVLSALLSDAAGLGLTAADDFGRLFGKATDAIEITGPLEIAFENIGIVLEMAGADIEVTGKIDERIQRVAGSKDLQITARRLPKIALRQAKTSEGGHWLTDTKPILTVEFFSQKPGGGGGFGLSLELQGLEHPDFKLESPAVVGLVLYLYPELDIKFEASLLVEPRFRFVIPFWVLADGAFEIDKPIPSFNGTQSRIAIDVGLINSEVPLGAKLNKQQLARLNDLSKYEYRFGGEIAWGEFGPPYVETDDDNDDAGEIERYEFLFVEAHYDSASPIPIGPVGIYGLAGLFGRNIAPGMSGDTRDANAIANWIEGDSQGTFANILNWPSPPSNAGWHPARNFEDDEDLIVAGLKVRAGPTGPRTFDIEALLMMGFEEFWIALAGKVTIRVIKLDSVAIVVYDHPSGSFSLRIRFKFEVEAGGARILKVAGPIEISIRGKKYRIAVGHYLSDQGGPLVAEFFTIFKTQFYGIYDSSEQRDFGFFLAGMDEDRPDLNPGAFSTGLMYQYGPIRIGPSFIHVRVHAAAGYNLGLCPDPFVVVGELFLSGSLHVKVWVIKVGFALSAYLAGRLTEERLDFRGRLAFKIGLPWPIPDVKVSFSFGFGVGEGDIPAPQIESRVFSMSHAVPRARELLAVPKPTLAIDSVIALRFNKPISGVEKGADTKTSLPDMDAVNALPQGDLTAEPHRDLVETTLAGNTYQIEYQHFITDLQIRRRPASEGGAWIMVPSMKAAWEAPAVFNVDEGGQADAGHHALYLNTLLQPELESQPARLGRFLRGQVTHGVLPPCDLPERLCLMQPEWPAIDDEPGTGRRLVARGTPYGAMTVRETRPPFDPLIGFLPQNAGRLERVGDLLRLPVATLIEVPPSGRIAAGIEVHMPGQGLGEGAILVPIDVFVPGSVSLARWLLVIRPATTDHHQPVTTDCGLDLDTVKVSDDEHRIRLDAQVWRCTNAEPGVIAIGITVDAVQDDVHLRRLRLQGPRLVPDAGALGDDPYAADLGAWLEGVGTDTPGLFLSALCFDTVEATHDAWSTEVRAFGKGPPAKERIEQFLGSLLLLPDQDYEISYRVRSDGATDASGSAGDQVNAQRQFAGEVETIRFRTEAEPTRDIAPYLGFVYPPAGMAPVYAEQTVPVVSFRNQGLIKRIYRAYRRDDVLRPVIRDATGDALATKLTAALDLSSSAAGEVQEGLIAPCLSEVQGFTRLEADIFERELKPDMRYALSVEDTSLSNAAELPPYRSSFRTSRHATFKTHVAAANALLADPEQFPLVGADPANPDPSTLLRTIFDDVKRGALEGYDALVEAIYRRALAHEPGRLALDDDVGGDLAAAMVAPDAQGTPTCYGIALEQAEPLLGKAGVAFGGPAISLPEGLRDKGIALVKAGATTLLTVRDRSGSRLLVFRSADAGAFSALSAPVQLPIRFDGSEAIRVVVAAYVAKGFAALEEAERVKRVDKAFDDLKHKPGMDVGLARHDDLLLLNPVSGG
jgi:hypothetical protein